MLGKCNLFALLFHLAVDAFKSTPKIKTDSLRMSLIKSLIISTVSYLSYLPKNVTYLLLWHHWQHSYTSHETRVMNDTLNYRTKEQCMQLWGKCLGQLAMI